MLQTIKSVADLGNYLASKYGDRPQESCWLIAVNTQLRVLEIQQVAQRHIGWRRNSPAGHL